MYSLEAVDTVGAEGLGALPETVEGRDDDTRQNLLQHLHKQTHTLGSVGVMLVCHFSVYVDITDPLRHITEHNTNVHTTSYYILIEF